MAKRKKLRKSKAASKSKRKKKTVWYLQVNDPGGDAHRLVVHQGSDKGELQRLGKRIAKSHGRRGLGGYMLTKRKK